MGVIPSALSKVVAHDLWMERRMNGVKKQWTNQNCPSDIELNDVGSLVQNMDYIKWPTTLIFFVVGIFIFSFFPDVSVE